MKLDYDRLYIMETSNNKSHIAFLKPSQLHQDQKTLHIACLPRQPIIAPVCEAKFVGFVPARERDAELWDTYYNKVTCKTCLKRARG